MAESLIPLKLGFRYQAWLFWQQAAGLLPTKFNGPRFRSVSFEDGGAVKGFDDVVVELLEVDRDQAGEFTHNHYQAKYRAAFGAVFNVSSFIDPAFIGATSRSLLSRLGDAYRELGPDSFSRRRFWIVAPCPLDHTDTRMLELCRDHRYFLDLDVLAKGTTTRSRWFQLRETWRRAAGAATEGDLFAMLRCLRFQPGEGDINGRFAEGVSISLERVGLRPIDPQASNEPYSSIPWNDAVNGRKSAYTRRDIEEIVQREHLRVPTPGARRLGLRTDIEWGLDFDTALDDYLKLERHFKNRRLNAGSSWARVYQDIHGFLRGQLSSDFDTTLMFGAGLTIAFAAGYALPAKSAFRMYAFQRQQGGGVWNSLVPNPALGGWAVPAVASVGGTAPDFALGISISQAVGAKMRDYVMAHLPHLREIIEVTPVGGTGTTTIAGSSHAVYLVQELTRLIRDRREKGLTGTAHLFIAAPTGFAFLLGQEHQRLGRCRLYEYEFDVPDHPTYFASLLVPDDASIP